MPRRTAVGIDNQRLSLILSSFRKKVKEFHFIIMMFM